jgi:3-phosphoshikimate 1-carboxyvinyltransferase
VLIAGLTADGSTSFTEPTRSRDHTERFLMRARVPFERDGTTVRVAQTDELELEDVVVPADPSSAAFFVTAAAIVEGSRIVLEDVGLNWTRTAFFQIAQRMGAVVLGDLEEPGTETGDEPVGEIDVAHAPLEATLVDGGEVPLAIDELPLVALLGVFAEGETVVRDAAELRVKETDRIAAVVDGLKALGAEIDATADGFVVQGTGRLRGGVFEARGDHRMAMLGAIAGLASEEGVEVKGMTASSVSYPSFESDLRSLFANS